MTTTTLPDDMFDMDALVALVAARGVKAYVEHTGGGVATIYTGDPDDDGYYVAAAGPGVIQHRDYGMNVAHRGDFYVGPDGDEDTYDEVPEDATLEQIADLIVTTHTRVAPLRVQRPCPECDTTTCSRRPGYPYCYGVKP